MIRSFKILIICFLIFSKPSNISLFSQAVKGQDMKMHPIRLHAKNESVISRKEKPVIGFVVSSQVESQGDDVTKALETALSFSDYVTETVTIRELARNPKRTERFSLIWIHQPDSFGFSAQARDEKLIRSLTSYVDKGGRLLLTLQAVHFLNVLGYESVPLQDSIKPCIDEGYGRRLGFHAFRDHPVFTGLNGGAYLMRPSSDLTVRVTGFFGDNIPEAGKVIAVDWDYIFLRENSKLVIEYTPGKGKVLAVGGYMTYSIANGNHAHLVRFIQNCLDYLAGRSEGQKEFYWNYSFRDVIYCSPGKDSLNREIHLPPAESWDIPDESLAIKRRYATENFWDVAGERLLTMGVEKGGIEEVWAHPFMAFRDYEVGIRFDYRDTIYWLSDERPEIGVHPAFFLRQYKFPRAYLKELAVNDPVSPTGVIHYEYRGVYGATLVIRFKSNLRWMWPYSDRVTGTICHAWNPGEDALTIRDQSGDLNLIIGGNRKPFIHLSGRYDGFEYDKKDSTFNGVPTGKVQAAGLLTYDLAINDNLDIVYSAGNEGYDSTIRHYLQAIRDPRGVFLNATGHTDNLLHKSLAITTPDHDFNTGYRWALLATDRFFVNTPGMGKALVAGYSTTRHGWDGNHEVNGRPGYGWYFGRDAEWSGFALLDCGGFNQVRSQLEFFCKYQDLNGKILHEASTSGLVHYDAADATPLFIVLAGKYFRHTNDTSFLRKIWPNIKLAINFCFSTDTDNDHLIENTNVGHGWVEGGELYGSHATIYMAGAWGAALREAAGMAAFMKDAAAERYRQESEIQKQIIKNRFWDDGRKFFAYGMNRDSLFRHEQTILPAVPVSFGMADRDQASIALRSVAGNAFTTNWGVRILRDDSPLFKPTGYHYGSVWPLFTGWASLAEYATGRSLQGFSHLMNNLVIYRNWGLGFAEEVLNGAEYKPSGVCAHQCWSETMILQPAIGGLLGLEVNAQVRQLKLAPQLPSSWDSLTVRNIRIANQTVDFHFSRVNGVCEYLFSVDQGKPVSILFMPFFAPGTRFMEVTLGGESIPYTIINDKHTVAISVAFDLVSTSRLVVKTAGGISALPVIANPKPGDAAEGIRIISAELTGKKYQVEVEGPAGTSGTLEFWSPDMVPESAENARFLGRDGNISRFGVDFEKTGFKYLVKTISIDVKQ